MDKQSARLIEKRPLSSDTLDFCFELSDGELRGVAPGAHVDICLPEGLVRQYSLWDWADCGRRFRVAVKLEAQGRGGSRAMHLLEEGALVEVRGPRNNFPLQPGTNRKTLLAGGIGATPIYAMAQHLAARKADFQVFYVVRTRERAAFDEFFRALPGGFSYHLHCTEAEGPFDLAALVSSVPPGGDLYACGPRSMLDALQELSPLLRGGRLHFERFVASATEPAAGGEFEIELESSGAVYRVGPGQSVLEVLRNQAIHLDFGCTEGLCGSCMIEVVSGEVDHRDSILSPEERASNDVMCACVSRAKSQRLVLRL